MKPEDRLDQILQSVLEHAPAERASYLDEVCGSDEQLRRDVLTLLDSYRQAGGFMSSPVVQRSAESLNDDPELKQGDFVGPFRIVKVLGRGGMGDVYLAEHMGQSREVALKILPQDFLRVPQACAAISASIPKGKMTLRGLQCRPGITSHAFSVKTMAKATH